LTWINSQIIVVTIASEITYLSDEYLQMITMRLIAHKNSIRVARTILWAMLFQFFSPAILAATSEPDNTGYFETLCTIQGYKTVWVDVGSDQDNKIATVFECPYCLFNLASIDVLNLESWTHPTFVGNHQYGSSDVQIGFRSDILLDSQYIRGPPLIR